MPDSRETYTFSELCEALGKSPFFVRNLQQNLKLPMCRASGYSPEYLRFLEKTVAMRAFNIPLSRITDLFELEKKILVLLHIDALCNSETWYLGSALPEHYSDRHLLLTGHDIGFPVTNAAIQHNLDFGRRESELFDGREMGEDIGRILRKYIKRSKDIRKIVQQEQPVLRNALDWAAIIWGIR